MKKYLLLIISLTCLASCEQEGLFFPTATCQQSVSMENHPMNASYQRLLDEYVNAGIPGLTVLIDKAGEGTWVGSSGVARIENSTPLLPCNLFPTASVGKMYCGVATMLLVEDGILALDETIDQYLPEDLAGKIPNASEATLADVLSHTSGIPDYADNPNLMLDFLNDNGMDFSREAILDKYIYGKKAKFSPGVEYSYSNSNYEVLTLILDHVLNSDHADLYTDRIFQPLGLTQTFYKNETNYDDLHAAGMVNGYFDRHSDGKLENATDLSLAIAKGQTGSDGIVTTIDELHTFIKSIFEARIVEDTTLTLMKEYIKAEHSFRTYKYGLGLSYRDEDKNFDLVQSIGHSGSLPGFSVEAWYFPVQDTYIIFFANVGNILNGPVQQVVDEDFRKALYELVLVDSE